MIKYEMENAFKMAVPLEVEIGIWIDPQYRRKGYGSEVMDALLAMDWFSQTFFSVTGSTQYRFNRNFLQGNANVRFVGVGFYNAEGELAECEIMGVRNTPLDGGQHGVAIYGLYDDGGAHTAVCRDNVIYDFQKNGMAWVTTGTSTLDVQVTGNDALPGFTASKIVGA